MWKRFWFFETGPERLALFRILFGVFLLIYVGRLAPDVTLVFSSEGVYHPILFPDYAPPPWAAHTVFWAFLGVVALFTLGVKMRTIAPLALAGFLYHYFLNLGAKDTSYDRLILILLVFSCLAPLDGYRALFATRRDRVPAFAARLICVQVCAVYFGSGLWKLARPVWHDGRILEMSLIGPWGTEAGRWIVNRDWSGWVWTVLTWSVILMELALPFLLWNKRTRRVAMTAGIVFHVGVWILLSIPEFMVMVAAYPLFGTARLSD